ncbi:hypothetical protein OPT61_g9747 [Boeremia exigua]|uniref:Uncharacterized protein n=1 Tax=Boeremia exigua TaxID=749465 RepID=A0ACC2HSS9_9PLEO|nr:hypothetical protein OPT61_g9747 [Boeremia exigua]
MEGNKVQALQDDLMGDDEWAESGDDEWSESDGDVDMEDEEDDSGVEDEGDTSGTEEEERPDTKNDDGGAALYRDDAEPKSATV